MEQENDVIDLREIFLLLKKNLLLIVAATVAFAALGLLFTMLFITPQYQASATLIVNAREGQQVNQTNITSDQLNSASKLVDTYSVILTSDTVLEKTIENLQLEMSYKELLNKVSISAVNNTQVMKISVKDEDPQVAKAIVADIVRQAPDMIINTVKAGSVEVISQAKAGEKPVEPSKAKNTVIAALLGFVFAVGFVIIRNLMNQTFMTDDDISQKLGLTVLGVIPQVGGKE